MEKIINFNKENYHLNCLAEDDLKLVREIIKEIYKVYPKLKKSTDDAFNKRKELSSMKERIVLNHFIGVISEIGYTSLNITQRPQYLKIIAKDISKTLPYLLSIIDVIPAERYYCYEPMNIITLYLLNEMQEMCKRQFGNLQEGEKEACVVLLLNNIVRSLKSSLYLFAIGDDAHGYGLMRGILEQAARLIQLSENLDEYVKYVKLNNILQMVKMKAEIDLKDKQELDKFLKENKLTKASAENFLLYGWVKDAKGHPILNGADFFKKAYKDNAEKFLEIYHFASEFIHEDYVLTQYDYLSIRHNGKYFVSDYTVTIFFIEKEEYKFDGIYLEACERLKGYNKRFAV